MILNIYFTYPLHYVLTAQSVGGEEAGSDVYNAVKSVDKLRQEPEKIRKWREEQADRLAKKGHQALTVYHQ